MPPASIHFHPRTLVDESQILKMSLLYPINFRLFRTLLWVSLCPFQFRKGVISLPEFLVGSQRRADVLAHSQITISSLVKKTKNS